MKMCIEASVWFPCCVVICFSVVLIIKMKTGTPVDFTFDPGVMEAFWWMINKLFSASWWMIDKLPSINGNRNVR